MRLLIVDDDPRQQRAIRRAARDAGFDDAGIVVVASETEAEAELDEPFEFAVVDIMLTEDRREEGVRLSRVSRSATQNA
jgi:DNA-binding response OmpR family regulator